MKIDGNKTYVVVIVGAIVAILATLGYIPQDIANLLYGLLGFGGFATLRHAIAKGE